ncbi:MAG: ribonuclease E/G [Henriciella sp.]|nr:ribonuclease E/G [Henriciella sp.]
MSSINASAILTHTAPGETRAVAIDADGRPFKLFSQRWSGNGERVRFGQTSNARLRAFADALQGAFLELPSGEEAFLRLKSRDGLTEGALFRVIVRSEARFEKLARVSRIEGSMNERDAFELWCEHIGEASAQSVREDADKVIAAFDDALASSMTLPNGGRLHIERTRALTAFDIDTAGRMSKGSAGARALATNKEAALEMARQVSLRGLGGNLILDCVGPLNAMSRQQVQTTAQTAFNDLGIDGAKTLKPSPLGLLEASVPWSVMPVEDQISANPSEGQLLDLLRDVQREAKAAPMQFFELRLGGQTWQAYLSRRNDADAAIDKHFSGRLIISESPSQESRILKR